MAVQKISSGIEIIVLAAGLGTRMKSDVPKVLHRACGKPMICTLLEQIDGFLARSAHASASRFNVVVGYGCEAVEQAVNELVKSGRLRTQVAFTHQAEQKGTGHAVRLALESTPAGQGIVAVLNGDLPLFTAAAFERVLEEHAKAKSSATLASAVLKDAGQYGRVIRANGALRGVVEFKDATPAQKKISEFNGGAYLFDRGTLREAMRSMSNRNAAGEFYLPDVFSFARKRKKKILAVLLPDASLLAGVNTMKELAFAQKILYSRKSDELMAQGVFLHDPDSTRIGPDVVVGFGSEIGPNTAIHGTSAIGDKARIGANCEIVSASIGNGTEIRNSCFIEDSSVGGDSVIGPMARLRPGSQVGDHAKIGNFVEIKESRIGHHTNVAHLSYIGDAEIGSGVNIGCGFITCNFDGRVIEGRRKHRTVIGNDVFVGSDCQVVAPIEIADGTYVASGSTVTESVKEKGSLVIARSRQVTKPGYARKYRKPS